MSRRWSKNVSNYDFFRRRSKNALNYNFFGIVRIIIKNFISNFLLRIITKKLKERNIQKNCKIKITLEMRNRF